MALLGEMRHVKLVPEVISHNAAICACVAEVQWQLESALPGDMWRVKLDSRVSSYSVSISACIKEARWQLALVLSQLRHVRVVPDDICHDAAVIGFRPETDWTDANLSLYRHLHRSYLMLCSDPIPTFPGESSRSV